MLQKKHVRLAQITQEVVHLASRFGKADWDDEDGTWVLIYRLPLPTRYHKHKRYTACLIEIPPEYPDIPPNYCYVDPNLAITSEHYGGGLDTYEDRNWRWICAHLTGWNPKQPWTMGNNLMTVAEAAMYQLHRLK
jgi:hypothetical protein